MICDDYCDNDEIDDNDEDDDDNGDDGDVGDDDCDDECKFITATLQCCQRQKLQDHLNSQPHGTFYIPLFSCPSRLSLHLALQVRYCLILQFTLCALVGGFAEMMDRQVCPHPEIVSIMRFA